MVLDPKSNKSPPKKGKKKDLGLTLKSQVAKYHKVSMRCPKFFHPKPKYLREFMRGVHLFHYLEVVNLEED